MKVILQPHTDVSVARIDSTYHILVRLENKNYIHHHAFDVIGEAVKLAFKIIKAKQLDLQYWSQKDSYSELNNQFLIQYHKKKLKAHLWSGLDTYCRMWGTGGLGNGYDLFNTNLDRDICTMCYSKKNSERNR